MKDKYWAKKRYSKIDPIDYEMQRFTTPAGKLIDEVEKRTVLELVKKYTLSKKKNLKILDVATGPGRLAFYLEDHIKDAKITAVDINENMLKRAKQIAKEKMSRVKFMKGDIYHLPFKKEQFDIVVGLRFSMHLPKLEKALEEMSRILRPDGILVFDIFNLNSILKLRLLMSNSKIEDSGLYEIGDIVDKAERNRFNLLDLKGSLLFGETILREAPHQLLSFLSMANYPSKFFESFSTKIILCFMKI